MTKFVSLFALAFMLATLTGAEVGTAIAKDARVSDMPDGINYEIQLTGVWPDRYFAEFYDMPAPRSFYVNTYWTFEPSKYPLSPPVWVHHLNELTIKDTDYTVIQVNRQETTP